MSCARQWSDTDGLCESPHDCPAKWCAMITLYLDESGTHDKHHVVVAGFAGKKRHWTHFSKEWPKGRGDRPRLHLNTMPLKSRKEKDWLESLAPIPYESKLRAVFGVVNVADYFDLVQGTVAEVHTHGACLALAQIVDGLMTAIPGDERFEFQFEASPLDFYIDKMMKILTRYPGMRRYDGKSRIARWSFVPKEDCILFEPADYLANHIYHMKLDSTSQRAQWTEPIVRGREIIGSTMSRETARRLFSHLQRAEFHKDIPREVIKAYRKGIRSGAQPDPWRALEKDVS